MTEVERLSALATEQRVTIFNQVIKLNKLEAALATAKSAGAILTRKLDEARAKNNQLRVELEMLKYNHERGL